MSKLFRAVILGPPGSGKGTISERVARSFGLQHLSSGDFLRENIAANTGACCSPSSCKHINTYLTVQLKLRVAACEAARSRESRVSE